MSRYPGSLDSSAAYYTAATSQLQLQLQPHPHPSSAHGRPESTVIALGFLDSDPDRETNAGPATPPSTSSSSRRHHSSTNPGPCDSYALTLDIMATGNKSSTGRRRLKTEEHLPSAIGHSDRSADVKKSLSSGMVGDSVGHHAPSHAVSPKGSAPSSSYYFGFIPKNDAGNIVLLILLYMLQGVPVGLAFGTLPFLLKQKLSYTDMAIFSLAGYPYSLKLLWSPIVDSVFFKSIGRRKSWIIPIQLFTGLTFYWLSRNIDAMFAAESVNVYLITAMWFFVIFLCATQDIAVDGWALTLLSRENMQFASTCQTVGINIGYFMSFTIFLAFNSAEFCNKYIRSVPSDLGLLQLGPYLGFWALFYIGLTLWVAFFKDEGVDPDEHDVTIKSTYLTIMDIIKLPHMLKFIAVLLLAKVAFICNESVTALKLLEKGIQKEDLALAVLIDFPFQILFGYLAAQWSSGSRPLRPWLYGFIGRLAISLVGMLVVSAFPADGSISRSYFGLVIATTVLGSFTSTVQFVSMGAFFSSVADPLIGGTYMTLLNTVSNLGGTFPKAFVLEAVDYFTTATCVETGLDCVSAAGKLACTKAGGTCLIERDGYYWVGSASFVLGLVLLWRLIRPEVRVLESLPLRMWKVKKGGAA